MTRLHYRPSEAWEILFQSVSSHLIRILTCCCLLSCAGPRARLLARALRNYFVQNVYTTNVLGYLSSVEKRGLRNTH
ncbi:hypothetical protein BDZ94DRAFT_1251075 [Collybia nuda]|uniref:Uncharacterized protein n=1 Tax=Collybia nuda TaxID=64659 RepID=A0A9P5YAS4_9AGAR|nr:hypothetical protein BDZ94DRAFT_1251075 [Collybia nuda]